MSEAAAPSQPAQPQPELFLGAQHFTAGKGGIAVVARLTAQALARRGFRLRLRSLLDEAPGTIGGARWSCAKGNRLAFAAQTHAALLTSARHIYDSVGLARAHPQLGPAKRPYALWIHGIEVWYSLHAARARALQGAARVLVNSAFTLKKYEQIHGALPAARVCRLATEHDDPPAASPRFDGPPTVLALGSLDLGAYYKGQDALIACWSAVTAQIPEARLVIAGGGDGLAHTRALAQASPAAAQIHVLGFVPEADMAALWRRAHVLALPSRNEGFGLVYVEAMRHGLPVIASTHDAGQEINIDGETGFNVDVDQPGALAERVTQLLGDRALMERFGGNGFALWRREYRFSAFAARFDAAMQGFLPEGVAS